MPQPQRNPINTWLQPGEGVTRKTGNCFNSFDLSAFTLLEVMIASAIFFMGMFAILGVLSTGLRGASLLQQNAPTTAMAISDLVITNKLEEGSGSGDFGPIYPSYRWSRDVREIMTNGLFQVDVMVSREGREYSKMSLLLYKPDSPKR